MISHVNTWKFRYLNCLFVFFDDSQMPYDLKKYNIEMRNVPSFNGFAKPLFSLHANACVQAVKAVKAVLLWSTMVCDLQNFSGFKTG